jgi:Flp pilus assembly CpaF family ATPase
MAMLWSFATGHAGMTSVHGESAEHALANLVRFALISGARIEAEQALDWVREVDLVVHCDRPRSFAGGERRFLPRRIDEIVEVSGVEGRRLTLNPLFDGAGPDLRWLGSGPAYVDELEQAGFHVG